MCQFVDGTGQPFDFGMDVNLEHRWFQEVWCLYVSGREIMGDLKLSLHESGISRMAWTAAAAGDRVAPDADRVLSRWTTVAPPERLGARAPALDA